MTQFIRPKINFSPFSYKMPRHGGGSIDKRNKLEYNLNTKGATGRRSPRIPNRSNRRLGSFGGYFFLSLAWITREISAMTNKPNSMRSCHVTTSTTPFLSIGGKKFTPARGETAYRYW